MLIRDNFRQQFYDILRKKVGILGQRIGYQVVILATTRGGDGRVRCGRRVCSQNPHGIVYSLSNLSPENQRRLSPFPVLNLSPPNASLQLSLTPVSNSPAVTPMKN